MTREHHQRYMEGFGAALLMDDYENFGEYDYEDEYYPEFGQGPASDISKAFSDSAMAIGQLIDLGFKAEYHPRRRMKLAADLIPRYLNGMDKLYGAQGRAARKAKAWEKKRDMKCANKFKRGPLKGKVKDPLGCKRMKRKVKRYTKLTKRIGKGRKLLMPIPVPPFAVPIRPKIDDSLNLKIYADMIKKAGWNLPGGGPGGKAPIWADGGNITTTRQILKAIFTEALVFSLLPEAAVMNDPELRSARDSALAAVQGVLNRKGGVHNVFGKSGKGGRIPRTLRTDILAKFIQWHGAGMIPDNMPLPPWVFGFKADGSEDPYTLPTVGAYLTITEALGSKRLNEASIKRLEQAQV